MKPDATPKPRPTPALTPDTASLKVVGAYVFVSSDSLLAFDMFVSPVPNAKLGVMATYYVAQALIFCSAFGALV